MAADCKSAAPWSYGGSNPPLSTRFVAGDEAMGRLWLALGGLAALAGLAWLTLNDQRVRLVTVLILFVFAVKVVVAHRRALLDASEADYPTDVEQPR
jgi:hypothetical protein